MQISEPSNLAYTLRKSLRAKRIRITLHHTGEVTLIVPRFVSLEKAESFLNEKRKWIEEKKNFYLSSNLVFLPKRSKADFLKYKKEALLVAKERIAYFKTLYDFPVKKISIRNQKTRWGSCSGRGVIAFSYRILFLPPELQDYLVVHELCHLKEMNHGKEFWAMVGKFLPDYKVRVKEFKRYR